MLIYVQDLCWKPWSSPAQLNPPWPHSGHYCYYLPPPKPNNNVYNAFYASLAHLSSLWTISRCLAPKTKRPVWRGLDVSSMPLFIPNIRQHLHSNPSPQPISPIHTLILILLAPHSLRNDSTHPEIQAIHLSTTPPPFTPGSLSFLSSSTHLPRLQLSLHPSAAINPMLKKNNPPSTPTASISNLPSSLTWRRKPSQLHLLSHVYLWMNRSVRVPFPLHSTEPAPIRITCDSTCDHSLCYHPSHLAPQQAILKIFEIHALLSLHPAVCSLCPWNSPPPQLRNTNLFSHFSQQWLRTMALSFLLLLPLCHLYFLQSSVIFLLIRFFCICIGLYGLIECWERCRQIKCNMIIIHV